MSPLLQVEKLKTYFPVKGGILATLYRRKKEYVRAVDNVNFRISRGQVYGLVGESGCGKTTVGRSILRLIEPTNGKIIFDGVDVGMLDFNNLRHLRRRMQIIFQDPYASLNPRMKIKEAIGDALEIHGMIKKEKEEMILEMLSQVGLTPAYTYYEKFPHELSGGERQRVAIARVLVIRPDFIVADEPLSMLDVSVRSAILRLMMDIKTRFDLTYLFITHDLAVARYICDIIAVMYVGKIVEIAPVELLFRNALHPYTRALLDAIPVATPEERHERFLPKGEVPSPINPPPGCRFHPRCPFLLPPCQEVEPELKEIETNHYVACYLV